VLSQDCAGGQIAGQPLDAARIEPAGVPVGRSAGGKPGPATSVP
jgi:hypothetical protein